MSIMRARMILPLSLKIREQRDRSVAICFVSWFLGLQDSNNFSLSPNSGNGQGIEAIGQEPTKPFQCSKTEILQDFGMQNIVEL